MGFFNQVGRKVEEFKQTATDASEDQAEYRCQSCESWFQTDHDHCPDCGAEAVERATT